MTLAERLKSETRRLHTEAERSLFMGVLLRGKMEQAAYCALLRNLHAIYAALEPALVRHAAHPALAPVFTPSLLRAPSLAADLEHCTARAGARRSACSRRASSTCCA
jgi:heme oxygenase (biliverdin-producing, ferredoxin)